MSSLVEVIGISHNPILHRLFLDRGDDPELGAVFDDHELMRQRLDEARPDVIVVIASDHLNQFFMDNMPAFLVGKSQRARGPFPFERETFGLPEYDAPVNADLARWLVSEGFNAGVDFAFSDEFILDHAFTVPLELLRPEMDIPIVPIWTNVMAPPLPPATRFYAVGAALRKLLAAAPKNLRIAVVSSGHFALEIGGPKPIGASSDVDFDRRMMDLIATGDTETLIRESTFDRLLQAGNIAPGFLNYIMLVGLAGGALPRATMLRIPEKTGATYYMEWTF